MSKLTPIKYNAAPVNRDVYTRGNCGMLARELHKLTGWKLALNHWGPKRRFNRATKDDLESAGHAAVISPCKKFVIDVYGLWKIDDFNQRWGGNTHAVDQDTFDRIAGEWNYYRYRGADLKGRRDVDYRQQVAMANKVAKRIVEKVGVDGRRKKS